MRKLSIFIALIMLFILIPVSPADAATVPTVDTGPFTIVKTTAGNVSGEIKSDNGSPIIQRGIVYSLTPTPTIGDLKTIVGGTLGKFTVNISNLSANAVYYYAAYAINGVGVSYGPVKSLRTKKDNTSPTIVGATVSINNTYIDVNMSEYVYGTNKTALTLGKFKWTFLSNGGSATAATLTSVTRTDGTPLIGSESILRFWLSITGVPSGVETIQIWPLNGTSIYDASNNAMASTQTTGPKYLNDSVTPKIFSAFLSSNNTYMDITMTKGVYGSGILPLTASQFSIIFTQNDGTANNAVITGVSNKFGQPLVGGETVIRVYISVSGVPDGTEFVTIYPTNGSSIYDVYGNPMSANQSTGPKTLNDLLSPTIVSASLSNGNSYIDVVFSQGVYNSAFGAISPIDLLLNFTKNGGNASSVAITSLSKTDGTPLIGGESIVRVHLNVSGIPSGQETIEIRPAGPSSIYDYNGNAMFETQTTGMFALFDKFPPLITDSTIALDNSYIDITLNEGLYTISGGPITASNLSLTFYNNEGNATATSISKLTKIDGSALLGGETKIRVYLSITGIPSGVEAIVIAPINSASIYDKAMNPMPQASNTGLKYLYDQLPPKITGGSLAYNNTYMDVTMSEGVYRTGKTPLAMSNFTLIFNKNSGTATGVTISKVTKTDGTALTGGETTVRVYLTVSGTPNGLETIAITPSSGASIYDLAANPMDATQTTGLKPLNDLVNPAIMSGTLATSNSYMDIQFNKGVYSSSKGPISITSLQSIFARNGGNASAVSISSLTKTDGSALTGGETIIRVNLLITGTPSGAETVELKPSGPAAIYDINGNVMAQTQTTYPKTLYDKLPPSILSGSLSSDNSYIDFTTSEGIYTSGGGAITAASLSLIFTRNNGSATAVSISSVKKADGTPLTGNETVIRVYLSITGTPSGVETVSISPANGSSVYDKSGNAMSSTQTTGTIHLNDKVPPIITGGTLSSDNTYIDISISKGVYMAGKTPLTAECFVVFFEKNSGTATDVSITGISKTNGLPLTGGETSIRLYLSITGTPNGSETVIFYPEADYLIFDSLSNYMRHTENTGLKKLNSGSPINRLVHTIKTANGRNPGSLERTFIPGDFVPMNIKIDVLSTLTNPVIVANLGSNNDNFCLKELTSINGMVDTSSVFVYKNGVKLEKSFVEIVKENSNNTLRISVNQSFTSGDMVEIVYHTRFALTTKALRSKTKPSYGSTINFTCHVEWGNPTNYYSSDYPGPSGTDEFNGSIITADPVYLQ